MSRLQVWDPEDGCFWVWWELVDDVGGAFPQGFDNVEAFFAQRARRGENKLKKVGESEDDFHPFGSCG